jgi:hypothetical protein
MSRADDLVVLRHELHKALEVLEGIDRFYETFRSQDLPGLGRKQTSAVVVAQVLDNFYTCLETAFLRISRFFENSLHQKRWRTDLLEKMTLRIEGIRERVVSAESYRLLLELMRFRYFKRYYFELEYDWDKLDFLLAKYQDCKRLVREDLARFIEFLNALEK